ncbi:MAG: hypothetical protein CMI63_09880 [Parvularcula sp.]|nr:hypothetical protein [Parvularcula sp.]
MMDSHRALTLLSPKLCLACLFALVAACVGGQRFSEALTLGADQSLVVVLAGQSNMVSRGKLDNAFRDQVLRSSGISYVWGLERRPIADFVSRSGLDDPWPRKAGNYTQGVGVSFALALRSMGVKQDIVLVPCAVSGSSIVEWVSEPSGATTEGLYERCLGNVEAARQFGEVRALLFYQGERDARDDIRARSWGKLFRTVIGAFRADLDNSALPVFVVPLPELGASLNDRYPFWSDVQKMQAEISGSALSVVDSSNLKTGDDGLHLDSESHRILGWRLAAAFCDRTDVC